MRDFTLIAIGVGLGSIFSIIVALYDIQEPDGLLASIHAVQVEDQYEIPFQGYKYGVIAVEFRDSHGHHCLLLRDQSTSSIELSCEGH